MDRRAMTAAKHSRRQGRPVSALALCPHPDPQMGYPPHYIRDGQRTGAARILGGLCTPKARARCFTSPTAAALPEGRGPTPGWR